MTKIRNSFANSMLLAGILSTPAVAQGLADPQGVALPIPTASILPQGSQEELTGATQLGNNLPSVRTKIHTAAADEGNSYGIWAAGDSYKASFHDGMTFVPYLGSDYPHNQPLSWRTTSATFGNTELIEKGEAPTHVQQDYRYEYRFAGITEAYDVLAGGLEQTFVIQQLPAAGDLVITGAVTTGLVTPEVASAHQPLQFSDSEGRAVVGYGEAIAFDAIGQRVLVTTGFSNGEITLTVPGAWLATAAMPVVVDPLLTRVQIAFWGPATGGQVGEVDIARDDESSTNNVLITYTRDASALDGDLWARLQDDDFSGNALVFSDITTNWDTDETSCAFVGGADRFAIVFRRYFRNNTVRASRLRCHVHDKGDTSHQTNYGSLYVSANNNEWRPDVGGVQSYYGGDKALVVFQSEDNGGSHFSNTGTSRVWGVLLDPTTTNGTFGSEFSIYSSGTIDAERPSVNQVATGNTNYSWVCAFQAYNNSIVNDDWDVLAKRVDNTGAVTTSFFTSNLGGSGSTHQMGPVVEGTSGRYAVAFSTTDTAGTPFKTGLISGKQLRIERFDWSSSSNSPSGDKPPVTLRSNTERIWEATGLGFDTDDDSHFGLGFRSVSPGARAAYYARLGYNGAPTEGPFGTLLYYVANDVPTMVSCVYDNDHDDFMFAYGVDDGSPVQPVYAHSLTYIGANPASASGSTCGNATISYSGNQQIGSEFNYITVNNNGNAVGHFLLISLATTDVPVIDPNVFPGCRLLVEAAGPNYLGTMPFLYGPVAQWSFAAPEWLDPMTLHFQDWFFDGSFFYNTQRLSVPLIK